MKVSHSIEPELAAGMLCARRMQFCSGHRVHQHEGKCAHLHGHNYVVLFYAQASRLDSKGRVIDFSELKHRLGGWIDQNWDHGFILYRNDTQAIDAVRTVENQKLYLLESNPTAENMALHLLYDVAPKVLAGTDVSLARVTLWETENCFADVAVDNKLGFSAVGVAS